MLLSFRPPATRRCRNALATAALTTLLAGSAFADSFLSPTAIDVPALIPEPPRPGSVADLADLETVQQVTRARTSSELARVERVANQTVFTFAAPVLGDWFTAENLPRTAAWFAQITQESYAVALEAKERWARPRPHLRDPTVEPHPRRSRSPAYPSGHASDAATWWVILSEIFPEQRGRLERQVHEAMWCRVLGGSHYPTDIAAGKILGVAIGEAMLKSDELMVALDEIRSECAPWLRHPTP